MSHDCFCYFTTFSLILIILPLLLVSNYDVCDFLVKVLLLRLLIVLKAVRLWSCTEGVQPINRPCKQAIIIPCCFAHVSLHRATSVVIPRRWRLHCLINIILALIALVENHFWAVFFLVKCVFVESRWLFNLHLQFGLISALNTPRRSSILNQHII